MGDKGIRKKGKTWHKRGERETEGGEAKAKLFRTKLVRHLKWAPAPQHSSDLPPSGTFLRLYLEVMRPKVPVLSANYN